MNGPYKKVIFLDIDGVLNYVGSRTKNGIYVMDPSCTARLRKLVSAHNAVIVISSAWRNRPDWKEHIHEAFKDAGWDDPPIVDRTPRFYFMKRGHEIRAWLKKNPTERYVILDDDTDMLWGQRKFFVRTNIFDGGFKDEHVACIEDIWGK